MLFCYCLCSGLVTLSLQWVESMRGLDIGGWTFTLTSASICGATYVSDNYAPIEKPSPTSSGNSISIKFSPAEQRGYGPNWAVRTYTASYQIVSALCCWTVHV